MTDELNRQVVESIGAAVLLVGGSGRVVLANAASHGLFQRDLTGAHLTQDDLEAELPLIGAMTDTYRRSLSAGTCRELSILQEDDEVRYLWMTVTPADGTGRSGGAARVVALVDVTEALAGAPALRAVFSQVSHDLKSPLTSISGAAELLLSGRVGALEGVQRKLVGIIEEGTRKIAELLARTKTRLAGQQAVVGETRE